FFSRSVVGTRFSWARAGASDRAAARDNAARPRSTDFIRECSWALAASCGIEGAYCRDPPPPRQSPAAPAISWVGRRLDRTCGGVIVAYNTSLPEQDGCHEPQAQEQPD